MKRLIITALVSSLLAFVVGALLTLGLIDGSIKNVREISVKKKQAVSVRVDPKIIAPKARIGEYLTVGSTAWKIVGTPHIEDFSAEGYVYNRYLSLNLDVINKGNQSLSLDLSYIRLIDSKGRKYAAMGEAQGVSYNKPIDQIERLTFSEPVNPDVPRYGYIVFEIASDASGFELEVSNGQQSGFIELKL